MPEIIAETYDYVIVGGGTAGAVVAARLSEERDISVCLIEGGPSDVANEDVLRIRNWINLLGTEYDYDYPTTPQPRGNSNIRHSRAKVLGGCSSHNTMISFLPLPEDFADWEAAGAEGWGYEAMLPYYRRLENRILPVAEKDRNASAVDFVTAAAVALGVPVVEDFNAEPFKDGAGFFSVAYDPETNYRSSSSVAYLHPVLERPNLTLHLETWADRLLPGADGNAVSVTFKDGSHGLISATEEVVLCAGSIDTPRLLLHSGIGPAAQLAELGIDVVADVPGIGENLIDHPESVIIWETKGPLPPESAMDADAGLFVRRDSAQTRPDLMFHFYQIPFTENTAPLGYPVPAHGICMTPNVPRARSTGRLYLTSADPAVKPALDFRYFTDPDGYDEQTLVDGIKLARAVAATPPLSDWIAAEVAPGPDCVSDQDISAYARAASFTVFHPAGTCRMGDVTLDPLAVVDPELRLRAVPGVRVADASVFPSMPSVNPVVAVLMIGEKAADLLRETREADPAGLKGKARVTQDPAIP